MNDLIHIFQFFFFLVKDAEKRSPLHAAAYCGDPEITELLLMSGARVNTKDNRWLTPLHRACCSKNDVSSLCIFCWLLGK